MQPTLHKWSNFALRPVTSNLNFEVKIFFSGFCLGFKSFLAAVLCWIFSLL